jgi:hypothetical protein
MIVTIPPLACELLRFEPTSVSWLAEALASLWSRGGKKYSLETGDDQVPTAKLLAFIVVVN